MRGGGCKVAPYSILVRRQLEHEVARKPLDVPLDLLVQAFGGDSIGRGDVVAEDDALASNFDDCLVKVLDRYRVAGVCGRGHGQRIPAGRAESRHTRAAKARATESLSCGLTWPCISGRGRTEDGRWRSEDRGRRMSSAGVDIRQENKRRSREVKKAKGP